MSQDNDFVEGGNQTGHSSELDTKTSLGLDPKIEAVLAYFLSAFFSFISGLVFFLIEKENKFVRFHALQSAFFSAAMIVASIAITIVSGAISFIPVIGWLVGILLWAALAIGGLIYWIILIIKSAQGEYYEIPVISGWAKGMI